MCEVCDNTLLRHNRGNQFVIGDIERRVIDLYTVCGHAFLVPHVGDFLGGTLFDLDVPARGGGEVDGGTGGADVEWDAIVFGEDGNGGGADFVRCVAVGGNAVTADEDGVDPAVFHDGGCHVVADEGDVHAGRTEFIRGEACALEQGACLVGKDAEVVAFFVSKVHDGGGRAVFCGGELPCVAVGEESVAGLYEGERVLAYFFADVDVLLFDAESFIAQENADFGDGFPLVVSHDALHTVQRPREIDRSGTGGVQVFGRRVKAAREFAVVVGVDLKGGEVDADGSGVADGRCTAHLQLTDGRPDFALRFEVEVFGAVWEFCLVDDDEGALLFVEGEGFHVEDVCGHCVPLFVKYIMAPLPPRFAWSPSPVATGEAKIGDGMKLCDSAAASGRPADLSKKQAQRAQLIG